MKNKVFKLQEGEANVSQGKNQIGMTGSGVHAYLWIGGNGCYGTLSGMKTLESLAASIYRALGHEPAWLHVDKIKPKRKKKLTPTK